MFSRLFDGRSRTPVENRPLNQSTSQESHTLEYLNPTYDDGAQGSSPTMSPSVSHKGDNASIETATSNTEEGLDLFDIKAFEDMEKALKEIDEKKQNKELKIESLDRQKKGSNRNNMWRFGPAPIEDGLSDVDTIKLGSLQAAFNQTDKLQEIKILFNKRTFLENVTNEEATAALINYFAELGCTDENNKVDYDFVEQLLITADINVYDIHGQSLMHEVAREWNLDLAEYLKLRGAHIDHPDKWGRTPLFVAVASNHVEMTRWLVENKANLKQRTIANESQTLLHYAAKYNAVECFDLLLEYGANPDDEDGNGQTPLFVAAQYGQNQITQHMLTIGIQPFSVNLSGVLCIELIVQNLPTETAWMALQNFYEKDNLHRRELYHMVRFSRNYMAKVGGAAKKYQPPTLLEILVDQQDLVLVTNPVILQIIKLKAKVFGTKYLRLNVFLYLLFTLVWTASISIRESNQHGWTYKVALIVVLTIFGEITSFHFIWKVYREYKSVLKANEHEKERLRNDLEDRERYAHPRWEVEMNFLNKERDTIERRSTRYWSNGWNVIEAFCLFLSGIQFIIVMIWIGRPGTPHINEIRVYYSVVFLVVVWIRLNNCFHYSQTVGAFVAMLGECVIAVARFGFLFLEFFIPFTCSFWVLFGGNRKVLANNEDSPHEYTRFNNLVYQMYLLTIIGDYDLSDLKLINEDFAQIFVALYAILVSVITLNLFIALMSEAIARINEKASAQAYMKEAGEIAMIEKYFPSYKDEFENFLRKEGNPWIVNSVGSLETDRDGGCEKMLILATKQISKTLQENIRELREMKKSMDAVAEKLDEMNEKYPHSKRMDTISAINKTASFYGTFFNKVQRKTIYKVGDFFEDAISSRQYKS